MIKRFFDFAFSDKVFLGAILLAFSLGLISGGIDALRSGSYVTAVANIILIIGCQFSFWTNWRHKI